ncbi:parB-like nuclease domain protein [Lysobacter gummosus]|nr:parB-like nuclease domain protein [Lysobacter gummosus]
MWDDQFRQLVEDIRANGLLHPVLLLDDKVLDGRHRYRACLECGVEVRFSPFEGTDPAAFVISENLARRHLNDSQRALVASKLTGLGRGRPKKCPDSDNKPILQSEAAKMVSVARTSVVLATRLRKEATPALLAKVESGDIAVHEALKIAQLGAPAQDRVAQIQDRKQRRLAMAEAHHRSAGRATAPRKQFMTVVPPGTEFVRDVLTRLELFTNHVLGADGEVDAFVDRFWAEFDWQEPLLLKRLEHAGRGIKAVARLQQHLERRAEAA